MQPPCRSLRRITLVLTRSSPSMQGRTLPAQSSGCRCRAVSGSPTCWFLDFLALPNSGGPGSGHRPIPHNRAVTGHSGREMDPLEGHELEGQPERISYGFRCRIGTRALRARGSRHRWRSRSGCPEYRDGSGRTGRPPGCDTDLRTSHPNGNCCGRSDRRGSGRYDVLRGRRDKGFCFGYWRHRECSHRNIGGDRGLWGSSVFRRSGYPHPPAATNVHGVTRGDR